MNAAHVICLHKRSISRRERKSLRTSRLLEDKEITNASAQAVFSRCDQAMRFHRKALHSLGIVL